MNEKRNPRLDILLRDVHEALLEPLHTHGWTATIEQVVDDGDYLIITAERAGHCHRVALMYTAGTRKEIYKFLAARVEHIFINGPLSERNSHIQGVETPISAADDFQHVLVEWNDASSDGKFAPESGVSVGDPRPPKHRILLSEAPIEAIWLRLRQLSSVTLARKLVSARAAEAGITLSPDTLTTKAQGVAFALRNAIDYFHLRDGQNVSQRVLNLYYGSLSFAFAEMLASPAGAATLGDIEATTKQGHGLYTVDGEDDVLEKIVVGVIATGFFPTWLKFLALPTDDLPARKPRKYAELRKYPDTSWVTLEGLFARIPEISDLFVDIFDAKPAWIMPTYDDRGNRGPSLFGNKASPTTTYAVLVDHSARLTKSDIVDFPGPISQIADVESDEPGRHFRVAIDCAGKDVWWDALPLHQSPFQETALIVPLFGVVGQYRAICVTLLYALSIIVRYRPSVWRRVQEGDLDHVRVLTEAFLAVVERVLPEQFLEQVSGQRVFARQPGGW